MLRYASIDDVNLKDAWLTIGIFDGLHRGHQVVIDRLVAGARSAGCKAVVLTFDPHPAVVLGGRTGFKALTTLDERLELLGDLGVEAVIIQPFDRAFAEQSAEEFMTRLTRMLGLRRLMLGHDSALGRGREAGAARLGEIGRALGYEVEVVPPLTDAAGILSSTRIRRAVETGDVVSAAADLGRPFFLRGTVIRGDGRGRELGVPTANLEVPPGKLIPANGIYATWAWVGEERHAAASSIGVRPTFESASAGRTVEAYLLDFTGDLYGQSLQLDFVARLRDERQFSSVEALLEQIRADVAETRRLLG
jgi:riboflavin kinase/FMN adenylyltransferase